VETRAEIKLAPSALVRATHEVPSPDAIDAVARGPHVTQQDLIDDQLAAIRKRIRAAGEHMERSSQHERAPTPWPSDLLAAETRIEGRIEASHGLPIARIRDRFALTATEERTLWFLIAHELCPMVRHAARGLSTEHVSDPSSDVIRRVIYGQRCGLDVWRELGPGGTLRRFGFIERSDEGTKVPEHRQTWKVAARVLALVHGDLGVDPDLADIAAIENDALLIADLELAGNAPHEIESAFAHGDIVIVHGRAGSGRRSSLVAVAQARGFAVLRVDARSIAKDREAAQRQLRCVARECRLLGLTPLLRDMDALFATSEVQDRIDLVETELPGLVLATSARPIARRWKRAPIAIELAQITGAQRASLWRRAIPTAGTGDADILATTYPIAPGLIEAAGRLAVMRSGADRMRPEHIKEGLRAVLDDRLAGLAKRIEVTQSWDDIVLPDDQAIAMIELLARIRERTRVYEEWGFADKLGKGLGVSALFSGPPGTGKTMVAGLVARALRVELYQVDISKVVSKWIGETEKNLAALFDAAEAGHAILLFDEADALFGKRTDVRSSNDRHANQEVNFLLQRLESYAGICILTTNHETAIDEAFRRRLSVHVRFPMPEAEERARLWRAMIPASAPRSDVLGLEDLAANYVMSGGYIRNAVLRAAFLAADEGGVIDSGRLTRAAQLEYEALGKIATAKP
jgi:hypothetical protein